MADQSAAIAQLFDQERSLATQLLQDATTEIQQVFTTLGQSNIYAYSPYNWQSPSPPIIGPLPALNGPSRPGRPANPLKPVLAPVTINIPNPTFGTAPTNAVVSPSITIPSSSITLPSDNTGSVPSVSTPNFPGVPSLLSLPSTALPYPFLTIPNAPVLSAVAFSAQAPDDIATMTVQQYLDQLAASYTQYSQSIPMLVQNNWLLWFNAMVGNNPNIRIIDGIITTYMTAGGAGVPVPIEEAIITRAVDRTSAEYRRARTAVWEDVSKRGLTLPSGALQAGLRAARGMAAEAASKVAVDVGIKNLELEHDHMKFMITMGVELNKVLLGFASETAKVVVECNAQAIELTKLVLTGMIEANNMLVKVYLAKWEGYRAAVEVFKARIQAQEMQIQLYKAQIEAELAKTEINKATVEVLNAIVNANRGIVDMYKSQIDAETAKLEADRIRIMGYEAQIRAYVSRVEAYKAQWEGYKAQVEGQVAIATVYRTQIEAYTAQVNAYKANVEAYGEQVRGYTAQVEAVSKVNNTQLQAWSIELEGVLKAYVADTSAYAENWKAVGEQARAGANITAIQTEFLSKMYTTQVQIDIERAREHLAQWRSQLEGSLQATAGQTHAANVTAQLAGSALNGLTAFAGTLSTSQGS